MKKQSSSSANTVTTSSTTSTDRKKNGTASPSSPSWLGKKLGKKFQSRPLRKSKNGKPSPSQPPAVVTSSSGEKKKGKKDSAECRGESDEGRGSAGECDRQEQREEGGQVTSLFDNAHHLAADDQSRTTSYTNSMWDDDETRSMLTNRTIESQDFLKTVMSELNAMRCTADDAAQVERVFGNLLKDIVASDSQQQGGDCGLPTLNKDKIAALWNGLKGGELSPDQLKDLVEDALRDLQDADTVAAAADKDSTSGELFERVEGSAPRDRSSSWERLWNPVSACQVGLW